MSTNVINLDETAKNSNSSSMKIFKDSEFGNIRVFIVNGIPMFVASDIAKALGYKDPKDAVLSHCKPGKEANYSTAYIPHSNGIGGTRVIIIGESNVYRLIMRSNLPNAVKFQDWVCEDILPSIRKTGSYAANSNPVEPVITSEELELKKLEAEARLIEAKNKTAEMFLSIGDRTSIPEYKQILDSYAANTLAGKEILALPEADEKTYSATEIGKILGVSANKIGKLANQYNLKVPEFGKLFYDKSRYSNKEVETFRYYDKAINKFRELLK